MHCNRLATLSRNLLQALNFKEQLEFKYYTINSTSARNHQHKTLTHVCAKKSLKHKINENNSLAEIQNINTRYITSDSKLDEQIINEQSESKNFSVNNDNKTEETFIKIERILHLHIMVISMDRNEKRNCVNKQMAQELLNAFHEYESDENMHCAVLYGIGGNFSAGYDLEELANIDDTELGNYIASIMMDRGPMGPTRMQITKPVIAAIEGWCVAGGLELALLADLRVADSCARLGFLNRRFGVPLLDGGSVRLPHLIGLSRAMDLILTGRIIEATEAHIMGLVNIVTKTGTAYGRAMELAKQITTFPQLCLKTDRASTIRSTYNLHLFADNFRDSLENEGTQGMTVISKESIEGAKKFVSGLGKHAKFNVNEVGEKQEWQKEYEEIVINKSN